VSIPEPIDEADTMLLKNLSSLRGDFAGYKEQGVLGCVIAP
jgi:hypothetical protein